MSADEVTEKVVPGAGLVPVVHHFRVAAREMLFEAPEACPGVPALSVAGLAVTETHEPYLLLDLAGTDRVDRAYLGPSRAEVLRRAELLAAGFAARKVDPVQPEYAMAIAAWVLIAWDGAVDGLLDAWVQ